MKFRKLLLPLVILFITISLTAQENQELRTYLPAYRMKQFFKQDISGRTPWYSMRPIIKEKANFFSDSLPVEYSYSTGEMILKKFDQIYYFSAVFNENRGSLLTQENFDHLNFLQRIKASGGTEIILCLSGDSGNFIPLLRDENRRSMILLELSKTITRYDLSGIDLDWEFPRNEQEKDYYVDFLQDLKTLCSSTEIELTIAASRFRALPQEAYSIADNINLMTYDFYGRHSTVESTKEALEYMISRYEIPSQKLLMGIPYYGRIFDGYSPDYWKKSQSYRELLKLGITDPRSNEVGGFFFNGPDAVREKVSLGRSMNLKGFFIWEIGQDSFSELSLTRQLVNTIHP